MVELLMCINESSVKLVVSNLVKESKTNSHAVQKLLCSQGHIEILQLHKYTELQSRTINRLAGLTDTNSSCTYHTGKHCIA